ncbi:MAG: putative signal transducing protein [Clostridium baratii]
MKDWIEIISFTYPHEAHLAKSLLEASNIEVFIKDEFTIQVNNFYSNAIGGVKILVEKSK